MVNSLLDSRNDPLKSVQYNHMRYSVQRHAERLHRKYVQERNWSKKKIGLFALVAGAVFSVWFATHGALPARADTDNEPYSIFILAGQSLAAGVNARRDELTPGNGTLQSQTHPADTATDFWWAGSNGLGLNDAQVTAFFPFYNGGGQMGWAYSGGENTANGVNRLRPTLNDDQVGVFGSEFGIARNLYEMGRRKVIILKVTYGFQSLAQSNSPIIPFDWNIHSTSNDPDKPKSYTQLKDQFNKLTTYLKSQGKKYTVDGIFWMQGETDTLQDSFANAYQQNLTDLVNSARQDLQLHPQGHFVIGKTSMENCLDNAWPRFGNYCDYQSAATIDPPTFVDTLLTFMINPGLAKRVDVVRAAQQYVADHDQGTSQKVDIVEAGDLPRGSDFTHLTAPGQVELGRRFTSMYSLPKRYTDSRATDYDQDGILNADEDTGRGPSCPLIVNGQTVNAANDGNLGDDDSDCDGYPNYLDRVNGPGSGL